MLKKVAGLILAGALWSAPSFAFCSKPDAPLCATDSGRFDDTDDFESCKNEMESYRSDAEEFLSCQKRENEEAIEEYNDAVRSFNDRARGS
jgi:hypothetical protein